MEYGLGQESKSCYSYLVGCLNPCFNGIWSRTVDSSINIRTKKWVLILVLMEYGLGQM